MLFEVRLVHVQCVLCPTQASSQGSSSGKRMSALIIGLQDRVQEAQRQQLNQRALVPHNEDLKDITIVSKIGTGGFSACYLAIYQGAQVGRPPCSAMQQETGLSHVRL